jgi:hypothetical protein
MLIIFVTGGHRERLLAAVAKKPKAMTLAAFVCCFASNAPFNENRVLERMLAHDEEEVTGVLELSRRENSTKSRADSRVRM